MNNKDLNLTICETCKYTAFCESEGREKGFSKKVNALVRQHRHFMRRSSIFIANDKFTSLFAIKKGVIKTFQTDPAGNELIRRFYFEGEILGYEAISTGHHPFSAVSLCETVVCEIPYDAFFEKIQTKPALIKHLLTLMSQELAACSYLEMITAEQRLAAFILNLAARLHHSDPSSHLLLPISRQDIGSHLRLASETVSRIFSRFQKNKLIEINHKYIRILKPNKLVEIAGIGKECYADL